MVAREMSLSQIVHVRLVGCVSDELLQSSSLLFQMFGLLHGCVMCCIITSQSDRRSCVYVQTRQHKVLRVKLERRLGCWHRNTSCTTARKLCGFSFTLHRWKMENTPDLGDKMDSFSPQRNPSSTSAHLSGQERRCLCGRQAFFFFCCCFSAALRKYERGK